VTLVITGNPVDGFAYRAFVNDDEDAAYDEALEYASVRAGDWWLVRLFKNEDGTWGEA
jgi:hypothetical protein